MHIDSEATKLLTLLREAAAFRQQRMETPVPKLAAVKPALVPLLEWQLDQELEREKR